MITVIHSINFRDTSFYGHDDIITVEQILEGFDNATTYPKVTAVVDTDDLDEAYRLTNSITHNWTENEEVTAEDLTRFLNPKGSRGEPYYIVQGKNYLRGGSEYHEVTFGEPECSELGYLGPGIPPGRSDSGFTATRQETRYFVQFEMNVPNLGKLMAQAESDNLTVPRTVLHALNCLVYLAHNPDSGSFSPGQRSMIYPPDV